LLSFFFFFFPILPFFLLKRERDYLQEQEKAFSGALKSALSALVSEQRKKDVSCLIQAFSVCVAAVLDNGENVNRQDAKDLMVYDGEKVSARLVEGRLQGMYDNQSNLTDDDDRTVLLDENSNDVSEWTNG